MRLDGFTVRAVAPADEPAVQNLFETDPGYFEIVQGAPPGPAEFQSLVTECAPGKNYDDKFVYCVLGAGEKIVAVIDIFRDYPESGIWFIGLLFVGRVERRQGLGSRLVEAICAHIAAQGGHAARIAVAEENLPAMKFWRQSGFEKLYSAERARAQTTPLTLQIMERMI